jgi:elongation factor Ts
MECKQALVDADGDLEKATELLRQKGLAQVAKRSDRVTTEGIIEAYVHTGGRVAAMVELGCETDFVARTPEFRSLAHDLAMQVAAMAPAYVDADEMEEGDTRPAAQVTLLRQPFIKGSGSSVEDTIKEVAAKVGENIRVRKITRLALGE